MKILILPDVHARPFWREAVDKYADECDKIVFLGDYVDPYQPEGYTRKDAIKTLEDVIEYKRNNRDKVILLIGNHDAHYFLKGFPRSTRYDSSHAYKLREIYSTNKDLFRLAYEETINGRKYLFTHAGVMNSWIERNKKIIGEPTVENLNRLVDFPGGISALSDISSYRTWLGEKSGSLLWSDILEKIDVDMSKEDSIMPNEDSIVDGYDFQIFGHTMMAKKPIMNDNWACIDFKTAFILDDNNLLTVEEYEKIKANEKHGAVQDTADDSKG